MCICGPSGGSEDEAGRLWGPPGEHGSKSPVSDTFWPTSATATGTGPSGDWLSTLIGSMSPWVLPERTQGTFRQYPGRHRPYQRYRLQPLLSAVLVAGYRLLALLSAVLLTGYRLGLLAVLVTGYIGFCQFWPFW